MYVMAKKGRPIGPLEQKVRSLVAEYIVPERPADRDLLCYVMADLLEELGGGEWHTARRLRQDRDWRAVQGFLRLIGGWHGKYKLGSLVEECMKDCSQVLYKARQMGHCRPEPGGSLADGWHPSDREDGGDIAGKVKAPEPYSRWRYYRRAMTQAHCYHLVRRALLGFDVPPDVTGRCGGLRYGLLRTLLFYPGAVTTRE